MLHGSLFRLTSTGSSPLGMTDTEAGGTHALSTVFSLLVWLTHTTWCTSARKSFRALLVRMLAASAKPNREWSVNTTWGGRQEQQRCMSAGALWMGQHMVSTNQGLGALIWRGSACCMVLLWGRRRGEPCCGWWRVMQQANKHNQALFEHTVLTASSSNTAAGELQVQVRAPPLPPCSPWSWRAAWPLRPEWRRPGGCAPG